MQCGTIRIFFRCGGFFRFAVVALQSLDNGYNEATDRIMHKQIREGKHQPGLKFYFTTGSLDETSDRNGNGIIDSIDDTWVD
jgi:hypothetical protein